jgi:D-methionine transport system permease protein
VLSDWGAVGPKLVDATLATLGMVGVATALTILLGLPLGVLLYTVGTGGLRSLRGLYAVLAGVADVVGSTPFFVLLVAVVPVSRAVAGDAPEHLAVVVPLTLGAVPFFARRVEVGLRGVDRRLVDAALAMGARARHVLVTVLLREGMSRIVTGLALTVVILLGYSAIAGVVYAEGLGRLALDYGLRDFHSDVVLAIVVVFVVLTQGVKLLGGTLARRLDHRR